GPISTALIRVDPNSIPSDVLSLLIMCSVTACASLCWVRLYICTPLRNVSGNWRVPSGTHSAVIQVATAAPCWCAPLVPAQSGQEIAERDRPKRLTQTQCTTAPFLRNFVAQLSTVVSKTLNPAHHQNPQPIHRAGHAHHSHLGHKPAPEPWGHYWQKPP